MRAAGSVAAAIGLYWRVRRATSIVRATRFSLPGFARFSAYTGAFSVNEHSSPTPCDGSLLVAAFIGQEAAGCVNPLPAGPGRGLGNQCRDRKGTRRNSS